MDWTGFYFGIGGGGSFAFSDTDASGGALIAGEGLTGEGISGPLVDDASGREFGSSYYDCPDDQDAISR